MGEGGEKKQMNIIGSIWRRTRSIGGWIRRRKATIFSFLIGLLALYWIDYSYKHYEFSVFVSYSALLVASIAALATLLALKYTRDTVRPFLAFGGTINLGGPREKRTLAFPITNTGSMPANDVRVMIDPFGIDEEIGLEDASKKFGKFVDVEGEGNQEALVLFPNQTWQQVLTVDLTIESNKKLWEELLNGHIKLRITISYSSFRRKHKTIQTLVFDELSLSKDGKRFHGLSLKPQKWV